MAEEDLIPKKEVPSAKPLRTYQSDVEEMLKNSGGSFARIAIAEGDKKARTGQIAEEPETPDRSKTIIAVIVVLVVISVGLLVSLLFFRKTSKDPVPVFGPPPLLISESQKNLDVSGLNRDQIISALTHERDTSNASLSSVVAIRLNEGKGDLAKPVTAEKFLADIQSQAPNQLVRSLETNFMFGLHSLNRKEPFLVLKTSYYQNAFAGMLAWEKTLIYDLGPIFIPTQASVPISTSDQITNKITKFEDMVVENRDARALRGEDGEINFLYAFADKNTIIITTNSNTLEQVSAKLLAGKLVQ